MPGKFPEEVGFAQCHPPAFQEALLISLRKALQFAWRDPRPIEEASKQVFPDALEERSLHIRIKPRHERLQAGSEKAQGAIGVVPIPTCPMAEGAPVMRGQLR